MKILCQKWEESEQGWGVRPDGYSLHALETDRQTFIKEHNARLPDTPPAEYSRPSGTPYWYEEHDSELLGAIAYACGIRFYPVTGDIIPTSRKDYVRFYNGPYPGDHGPDGWRQNEKEDQS